MPGAGVSLRDLWGVFLAVGIVLGFFVGLLTGALVFPHPSPTRTFSVPSGLPPLMNCFGGETCSASGPSTDGSGTTCVVSGFSETAGDFLYVAINYMAGTDRIISVADGGVDSFNYVAGEFANDQSVAFYTVSSVHGGTVTITVTLSVVEFGTCTVGQLSAGTTVGVIGPGGTVASGESLSVTNAAVHEPALLMALFGATRPTGTAFVTVSAGGGSGWQIASQWTGYTYNGTAQILYGENDGASGTVIFTWQVGNTQTPSISGIAVEFYLGV